MSKYRTFANVLTNTVKKLALFPAFFLLTAYAFLSAILGHKKKQELIWGLDAMINYKYWSNAMAKVGWASKTFVFNHSILHTKNDFDCYVDETVPSWVKHPWIRAKVAPYFAFKHIVLNAKVIHLSYHGGPLFYTPLKWLEAYLYRRANIKMVIMPYGGDAYMPSKIIDPTFRNAFLISYPELGRDEYKKAKRIRYWNKHADLVICGFLIDGMGRWDVNVPNMLTIDVNQWVVKPKYNNSDGTNGVVRILHAPNHRGFKGTEFVVHAVEELKKEGLKVELVLLEKVPNTKVQELMQEVDILADQFICSAYALSAIEGMASGLPLLSNLEHEAYTRLFRRYAYLNECPILSTIPETLKQNLRVLVTNPKLREELGKAGRAYVEKYHSEATAQYLFGSVYKKILNGEDIDLMNLFHPLKSEYNRSKPLVISPLIENRLPLNAVESL